MTLNKLIVYILFFSCALFSCKTKTTTKEDKFKNPTRYDVHNPAIMKLPDMMAEISGIVYYPKDSTLFGIIDEDGLFYKIPFDQKGEIKRWRFNKGHDYEDLVLLDSVFYVLVSNGKIETLKFVGDSIESTKSEFPNAGKKTNEFESLYYDDSLKQFVLLCKDCELDNDDILTAWGYDTATKEYKPSIYTINVKEIAQKLGVEKLKLKPSGASINPVTNDLYIISAINNLIVITDRAGKFKDLYQLDPAIYKQPEGITFTPSGDMIISNESNQTGLANILFIKDKKTGI
ncbi:MAG: SdiA-regulated domain-containing protein [Bacteroidota bacterium]